MNLRFRSLLALPVVLSLAATLAVSGATAGAATPHEVLHPAIAPVVAVTADPPLTFGPLGYGALRVHMRPTVAAHTGMFASTPNYTGPCTYWPAKEQFAIEGVVLSRRYGVVTIFARNWASTPEGMHVGMTTAQVKAMYPNFRPQYAHQPGDTGVAVPGHPTVSYGLHFFEGTDWISSMTLQVAQDCGVS